MYEYRFWLSNPGFCCHSFKYRNHFSVGLDRIMVQYSASLLVISLPYFKANHERVTFDLKYKTKLALRRDFGQSISFLL